MADPSIVICMPFTVPPEIRRHVLLPFDAVRPCRTGCQVPEAPPEAIEAPPIPEPPLSNFVRATQFSLIELRSNPPPPASEGALGRFTQVTLEELRPLPDKPLYITQYSLLECRQSNEYPPP